MPNPYDDLFGGNARENFGAKLPPQDSEYPENKLEPLDEILKLNADFQARAKDFSELLSRLRVIDHKAPNELLSVFVKMADSHDQGSLVGEKSYHELLSKKFRLIIAPMRELASLHLEAVKQFNYNIDDSYFSVEKEDVEVKSDKDLAVDSLLLQRKILEEAAENLQTLAHALQACERRMKKYINAGGSNNLSASELAILESNREQLTSGMEHQFEFAFFDINLLDKAAITLGIYAKETTSQYLRKLKQVFENRK